MDRSFVSPEPICSNTPLVCPSAPRGRRPCVTFDDKHITVPLFLPGSCSILGADDSSTIDMDDELAKICNRPTADFTLKNRRANSEVPARKILIQDFPTLPFLFPAPANQATSTHPASMTMPRSSSDPKKIRSFQRRRSSITGIDHRCTSLNARCA